MTQAIWFSYTVLLFIRTDIVLQYPTSHGRLELLTYFPSYLKLHPQVWKFLYNMNK